MSAPLVERLQKAADRLREKLTYRDGSKGEQLHWPGPDIVEAASTIEAQAAEIERLKAEPQRDEHVQSALAPYLPLINGTPELLSLLYDIDMLPEQTVTYPGAVRLAGLCEVWKRMARAEAELAAKDAAVQILLGIPLVCVTDAEIAHAKERRAAAIRASGKEG